MNKLRQNIILLFLVLSTLVNAQKVGLVLSGGGAKGCTHIGVIKALEENNVPIDYVAGTSMGAIVSSLYAMGYSPDEMKDLLVSPEFSVWIKGQIDDESLFYFKKEEDTPEFISFKMSIDDSLAIKPVLPSSVLSPDQLNHACMYLFAQSTTACNGNFDSLFVPFRCVAADIQDKKAYIHRKGDLGDAVRTSMSFPFVFKPINVDGHLMLDGGIYNNFPIDVMKNDLKADFIIGSSVSANPSKATGEDLIVLLENLIMKETNYKLDENDGVQLNFKYTDVSLLDFDRAEELIQIGYDSTIAHIDEIKANIHRTISTDSLNVRRAAFQKKKPDLTFKNVIIRGVKPQQRRFIKKTFLGKEKVFTYEQFRRNYFKLLSDKKIAEIIPHAIYNPTNMGYDLILDVELNDHFKFGIGGNISSTTSNQLFISAKYVGIQHLSYDFTLDGQIGVLYNNVHMQARIDFPYEFPFCLKVIGDINYFKYSNKQTAFYEMDIPTEANSTEFFTKGKFCIPFLMKGEVETGVGYGRINNKYHGLHSIEDDQFDHSYYNLGNLCIKYTHNSLSHKQYPIFGSESKLTAQYIYGKRENSVNTPIDSINFKYKNQTNHTQWLILSGSVDKYIPIKKHFSLGLMGEAVYSTHKLEDNYMETLMMSPSFTPTKHSKMVFNPAFSATTYFAVGIKPIFKINDFLHIRFENFAYAPYKSISPTATFGAEYDSPFSKMYLLSELTCVAQLKYITAGIYGNWYSYPKKNWNFGLNMGYLIFHDKFIEK